MSPHKNSVIPEKYVSSFNMNGLNGRCLKIPNSKKKREILLVYGHHASLERMYPFAEVFSKYGTVTMPDLPGFGGMDSFYKVGEEPSYDTLADYLAAVIKLHYKQKRITLVGFSLGFAVITRMLQKYPDIVSKVDLTISISGFTSWRDFKIPRKYFIFLRTGASLFSGRFSSKIYRRLLLSKPALLIGYKYTKHAKHKLKGISKKELHDIMNFEVELWQSNDPRTRLRTTISMFSGDLTPWTVPLSVYHVSFGEGDQYFEPVKVIKNLESIYSKVIVHHVSRDSHMPSVLTTQEQAEGIIPAPLARILARKPAKS